MTIWVQLQISHLAAKRAKRKRKKRSKKQKKTNGCLGTKIEHNENSLVAIKIRKC